MKLEEIAVWANVDSSTTSIGELLSMMLGQWSISCCMICGYAKAVAGGAEMLKMIEEKGEGLLGLMGEQVILFCANYFYAGKLVGVNKTQVMLEDPSVVYETGEFSAAKWKDAQKLHVPVLYVRIPAIEAYAKGKA